MVGRELWLVLGVDLRMEMCCSVVIFYELNSIESYSLVYRKELSSKYYRLLDLKTGVGFIFSS
jgi:hypothetical protein